LDHNRGRQVSDNGSIPGGVLTMELTAREAMRILTENLDAMGLLDKPIADDDVIACFRDCLPEGYDIIKRWAVEEH